MSAVDVQQAPGNIQPPHHQNISPSVPRQLVVSLPIANSTKQRLLLAGFQTLGDLNSCSAEELAAATGLPPSAIVEVQTHSCRQGATDGNVAGAVRADQLREKEARAPKITTYCQQLDNILGGGVQLGQITEFCGVPAIGKTQLGMQLALDVQFPASFGGAEGQAIYIDTEGSIVTDRVAEMAESVLKQLQILAEKTTDAAHRQQRRQQVAALSMERLLSNIHYFRCTDIAEQQAAIKMLPQFLTQHPQVKRIDKTAELFNTIAK